MSSEAHTFGERLAALEDRIESAVARSGRKRSDITLVAVTKKFSADVVREAYSGGLRHFGENYLQEFAEKQKQLTGLDAATFHLIGHLQSNKARLACRLFSVLETVDSLKLLQRIENVCAEEDFERRVLIEVKLSNEESKTGANLGELGRMMGAVSSVRRVRIDGLMTVPPWSPDPERSRPYFRQLAKLREEYGLEQLSMGMSGDCEVAIEEGATSIRVGTALFGARPKPVPEQLLPLSST